MLFYPQFYRFGDTVKAQIILRLVDFGEQCVLQLFKLHFVNGALEHGFLHALSHAFADLCNASQPLAAGSGFSGDIIGDDDEHGVSYFAR